MCFSFWSRRSYSWLNFPPSTHQAENHEPQTLVFIREIQFNFHNPEVLRPSMTYQRAANRLSKSTRLLGPKFLY